MALSDMIVFNDQIQKVATEVVAQEVEKFNAASQGTMLLGSANTLGDFVEEASYKLVASLVGRRDAYTQGALSPLALEQLKDVSVKVDQSVGPVEWTLEQFRRLAKSEEEAGLIIGEQAAKGMIQDYLNTGASCLKAAISGQASLINDISGGSTATKLALNNTAAKFGDRQQSINGWLMHSSAYTALTNESITNAAQLYTIDGINVMQDGLGRVYIVSDIPALFASSFYHTLGLTQGALMVETNGLLTQTTNNTAFQNMGVVWKGESSFTLGLKGYAWDIANGGKSPTNAELATATNWDKIATDVKDTAGVMLISD
jgi:hypothetical protein